MKQVTRESRACRLMCAAFIEHSAGLARTRWALDEILSPDAKAYLDGTIRELQERGISAENEAGRIEYQATHPTDEASSGDTGTGDDHV